MIADSTEELHQFAQSIGLKRCWFQAKSSPHYDLTKNMREKAIKAGAKELNRKDFVSIIRRNRENEQ